MIVWMRRFVLSFFALALVSFVGACGVDHSPVASGPDEGMPAAKPVKDKDKDTQPTSTTAASSTDTDQPLSNRTVQEWIGSKGGTLSMMEASGDPRDDLIVLFIVPRDALDEPHLITMTVHGDLLSELEVEFSPGGLEFLKDASLEVVIGYNRVDIDTQTLKVLHMYDDGTVEDAYLEAVKESGKLKLTIVAAVSGFSRYSVRR